ncbi:LytTR family DNA-binding domain-containing protein [Eubacterium sp. 1001713B170207_170306_E7]|uniref:LytR/AlgR family response regulator transcription factor n=1 Tax=Eubacterium sp. 1001713B170207_170306_E7 TaxID=2787097 RepID=UPI00189B1E94|nr:LytTR family DNA-binding domain-containing protein [Eubacterium sp. 1001713B170207_170306_E7]
MLRVAICDDEKEMRETLCEFLKGHPSVEALDCFECGEAFLQKRGHYDLVLLDIDMKGMNGIETGRRIRRWDKQVYIVYVTHLPDYQKYALGVHAFGYLEKPVNKKDIEAVLREVEEYKQETEQPLFLEFMTEEGILRFDVKEIFYFEYLDRRIRMCTQHGTFYLRRKMGEVAEQMKPYDFSQPHKSFCVNLFHVKAIKGYDIQMTNSDVVPLSQKKSAMFREQLNVYLEHLIG